jgi:hypothetical protein
MKSHTLVSHGLIHSPVFAQLSQKNSGTETHRKLGNSGQAGRYNHRHNHVPPQCSAYENANKYAVRKCIRLDLARTYKLQVTSHRPRPLLCKAFGRYSKYHIKYQRWSKNPMHMYKNIDLTAVSLKANDCTWLSVIVPTSLSRVFKFSGSFCSTVSLGQQGSYASSVIGL